jgi:hypothetical protein
MQQGKCQICLRRVRVKVTGGMGHHHQNGEACLGSGFPPIEQDDGRLEEVAALEREKARGLASHIRRLIEARANRIERALMKSRNEAETRDDKLERRLRRLQKWPDRFARQMATHGYGDPPPQYIAERHARG